MEPELQKLIDHGFVFENEDGTYALSDEAHAILTAAIENDPTLFAQWFPDRLN